MLRLSTASMISFHQSTCRRRHPFRKHSSTASPPLTSKTGHSAQLTLHYRRPCRLHPTMASPPDLGKPVTLPTFPPPAFPLLASATRRIAATRASFKAFPPRSLHTHDAPADTALYYAASPQENSAAKAIPADRSSNLQHHRLLGSRSSHEALRSRFSRDRGHQ